MKFKSMEHAHEVFKNSRNGSKAFQEAFNYIFERMEEPYKIEAIRTALAEAFPQISPCAYTPEGEPLFSVADIADGLGITEEEIINNKDAMEHMVTNGSC